MPVSSASLSYRQGFRRSTDSRPSKAHRVDGGRRCREAPLASPTTFILSANLRKIRCNRSSETSRDAVPCTLVVYGVLAANNEVELRKQQRNTNEFEEAMEFSTEGSAESPASIGDVSQGEITYEGQVASGESSYYVLAVTTYYEYMVELGDLSSDVDLYVYGSASLSDHLAEGQTDGTSPESVSVTSAGRTELFIEAEDTDTGTAFTLAVTDEGPMATSEGSGDSPVRLTLGASGTVSRESVVSSNESSFDSTDRIASSAQSGTQNEQVTVAGATSDRSIEVSPQGDATPFILTVEISGLTSEGTEEQPYPFGGPPTIEGDPFIHDGQVGKAEPSYYSFYIERTAEYRVTLGELSANVDLAVARDKYFDQSDIIGTSTNGGTEAEGVFFTTDTDPLGGGQQGQTYYIRATPTGGDSTYSLIVSSPGDFYGTSSQPHGIIASSGPTSWAHSVGSVTPSHYQVDVAPDHRFHISLAPELNADLYVYSNSDFETGQLAAGQESGTTKEQVTVDSGSETDEYLYIQVVPIEGQTDYNLTIDDKGAIPQ